MKLVLVVTLAAALAGCGGKSRPATNPDDDLTLGSGGSGGSGSAAKATPFEARRDAACEQVGSKVSKCAAEDTRNDKQHPPTADELAQLDQTAAIDKREYVKKCEAADMSSRQIRVMEVCAKSETECDPFLACMDNMKPQAGEK